MSKAFIVPSLSVLVGSGVLITIVYGIIGKQLETARVEELQIN